MAKKTRVEVAAAQEDVYEVEDIVDFKIEKNKALWRVRWKGYKADEDTWEPEDNLKTVGKELRAKAEKLKANRLNPPPPASSASRKRAMDDPVAPPEKRPSTRTSSLARASSADKTSRVSQGSPKKRKSSAEPPSSSRRSETGRRSSGGGPLAAAGTTRVVRIVEGRTPDDHIITMEMPDGGVQVMSTKEARKLYPEALFDYLLLRIKFLKSSSQAVHNE